MNPPDYMDRNGKSCNYYLGHKPDHTKGTCECGEFKTHTQRSEFVHQLPMTEMVLEQHLNPSEKDIFDKLLARTLADGIPLYTARKIARKLVRP